MSRVHYVSHSPPRPPPRACLARTASRTRLPRRSRPRGSSAIVLAGLHAPIRQAAVDLATRGGVGHAAHVGRSDGRKRGSNAIEGVVGAQLAQVCGTHSSTRRQAQSHTRPGHTAAAPTWTRQQATATHALTNGTHGETRSRHGSRWNAQFPARSPWARACGPMTAMLDPFFRGNVPLF